ncbi:MAG: penicillin-binding protein 2 [Candidatus Zixiibacteriota bacterium]|nr:MAG: penicillin-binding protein 2 [candidate division Zixibacteria bacterium]
MSRFLLVKSFTGYLPRDQRTRILLGLLCLTVFLLVGRLFFLQVVRGAHYSQISEENRIRPLILPASRGEVTDRNGRVIATNRPSYTVSLIPYEISEVFPERRSSEPEGTSASLTEKLASCLKLDVVSLEEKIRSNWFRGYQPIRLKKDVDFNTVCIIEEQNEDLPGVIYQVEPARRYLEAGWVGHVLGYVNELTREELSEGASRKGFRPGGVIGRKGMEKSYDELLRGEDGVTLLEVTARGKILGPLAERKPDLPMKGSDIKLTIDLDLQAAAESALTAHKSAAVVALDPRNGEILTMLSKPGLDANLFAGAMSSQEWNDILENPLRPLLTRPIQATYPPGSTMKLLTAGIALEENLAGRNTFLSPCKGSFHFGRRDFGCWRPEGHGRVNLEDAIIHSCDIYFYQLGLKVGLERWSNYAQMCGLGRGTGIDVPDEARGLVPTLDYYRKRHGRVRWIKNLIINLAIGQGEILTTPLQVAVFFGGLATEGTLYKPYLVKEILTTEGRLISTQPETNGSLPFSSATLNVLKRAMIGVVNDPKGTGVLAWMPDVVVAGKTGTAQNPHGEDHAWFVGFAPASDPQIVVVVLVENAGHGGTFAAPVAREIIGAHFKKDSTPTTKDSLVAISTHRSQPEPGEDQQDGL